MKWRLFLGEGKNRWGYFLSIALRVSLNASSYAKYEEDMLVVTSLVERRRKNGGGGVDRNG